MKERRSRPSLLESIANSSSEAIFALDCDGCLTFMNVAAEGLTGRQFAEVAGCDESVMFPAHDMARIIPINRRVMAEGCSLFNEETVPTALGERTFRVTRSPIRDPQGRVVGLCGIVHEVTELRVTARALRESERRYRAVVEDQTEVISRFRADGTFLFANAVYCRVFGVTAEAIIGRQWHPLAHPDDVSMIEERLALMTPEDPIIEIENRVYVADGELRWMHFINRSFFDAEGRVTEIQSVGRDITVQKQARQALTESEERLQYVLLATREAIWDCDLTTGQVWHNKRWCELLGFDDRTLEHLVAHYYDLIHPDDLTFVQAKINAALLHEGHYSAEYRLRRTDGSFVWVSDHGRVTGRAPDGRALRIVGAFVDISWHKAVQAQSELAKAQLHALAARLQAVREEERTRIAEAVHDALGQMLTALTLGLSSLSRRVQKVEDAALRSDMKDKLDELYGMVEQMIVSVREIATDLRPQILDSLGLAAAIRFEAVRFQERTGIVCRAAVPDEAHRLSPEQATALFRILQEALTNVVRHAGATQVVITLEQGESGVVLSVRDNGRGIAPDEIAAPGALGLLGMRERAAQFAGNVDIVGVRDTGTTVTVTLP